MNTAYLPAWVIRENEKKQNRKIAAQNRRKNRAEAKRKREIARAEKSRVARIIERNASYLARARNLRRLGFRSYREYLASDLWKAIRDRVLDRDCGRCAFCHFFEAVSVHHMLYDAATLRGDTLEHLKSTCGKCHLGIEFDRDGNKREMCSARRSAIRRMKNTQ